VIYSCKRCGHLWEDEEGQLDGSFTKWLCRACKSDLRPGDRLVSRVNAVPSGFLIEGVMYTVIRIERGHTEHLVTLYGDPRAWSLSLFDIVPYAIIDGGG
jgi:hypothetical protein